MRTRFRLAPTLDETVLNEDGLLQHRDPNGKVFGHVAGGGEVAHVVSIDWNHYIEIFYELNSNA